MQAFRSFNVLVVLIAGVLGGYSTGCGAGGATVRIGGPANVQVSMLTAPGLSVRPRSDDCYVDVVLDRSPERPYVVLGRLSVLWTGRGSRSVWSAP